MEIDFEKWLPRSEIRINGPLRWISGILNGTSVGWLIILGFTVILACDNFSNLLNTLPFPLFKESVAIPGAHQHEHRDGE